MGQYYDVYTKNEEGIVKVFDRMMEKEGYTLAKLMEHSWWLNPFMMAFSKYLYEYGPMRVAWVGDYADEFPDYDKVWGTDNYEPNYEPPMKEVEFLLDGKYLVNHTQKVYMDCDAYKTVCDCDGWIIHPLSLLTCIGNGRGGGDYRGSDMELIGLWCNDIISIEDKEDFSLEYEEIFPRFIE